MTQAELSEQGYKLPFSYIQGPNSAFLRYRTLILNFNPFPLVLSIFWFFFRFRVWQRAVGHFALTLRRLGNSQFFTHHAICSHWRSFCNRPLTRSICRSFAKYLFRSLRRPKYRVLRMPAGRNREYLLLSWRYRKDNWSL